MTARSSAVLRRVVASLLVVVGSSVAALVYWGILWSRADSAISCDSSRLSEVFGSKDVEAHPYLSDWPVAMMCKWSTCQGTPLCWRRSRQLGVRVSTPIVHGRSRMVWQP
jgi:hypothetical protein